MPKAVCDCALSVQVCPGWPRMIRLLLIEVAPWFKHENCALLLAPNGAAVIVVLPEVTLSPVELIPHAPPHE